MKKTLFAALAAAAVLAMPAAHAAETSVVKAIQACNADFFKAVAADKNIPESLKVRDGDMAYLKIDKVPLDVVLFEKPYKQDGLTVTGYIFNDEVIRYLGTPDMHTHFWGLLVKEDWKSVVDKIQVDWEAVDTNHKSAHGNRMQRSNHDKEWKPYQREQNYTMPELGMIERVFHVAPYEDKTMIFCSMQSAGAPSEAILKETRPDLLFGEKEVPVRQEAIQSSNPHAGM